MNGVRVTSAGPIPPPASSEASMRLTELSATPPCEESPPSTNTHLIYRFIHQGKICARILRPDQAEKIQKIFAEIHENVTAALLKDRPDLVGARVARINFLSDSIEIQKSDGQKEPIFLSSLSGDMGWYNAKVGNLKEILRCKGVGSDSFEGRQTSRSSNPKSNEPSSISIPGRFFGLTQLDLEHVGLEKNQKREDYLMQYLLPPKTNTNVFESEFKIITNYAKKQYRNNKLTPQMEQECKMEARARAVAVEMGRTKSDEKRIELFTQLTIEHRLPCDDQCRLRTQLDDALFQCATADFVGVRLNPPPVPAEEAISFTPEDPVSVQGDVVDRVDERVERLLEHDSKIPEIWKNGPSGGGRCFSGFWNWISGSRSVAGGSDWVQTGNDGLRAGQAPALAAEGGSNDEGALGIAEDGVEVRPRAASISELLDQDLGTTSWTEFLQDGVNPAELLNEMQAAAKKGGDALKRFLTVVLDDSSELNPDLLIQYLNKAVKEKSKQRSKFSENSLVAVLKDAWGCGPGPSEFTIDPAVADSKQFSSLNGEKSGDKGQQDWFDF